MTTAVMSLPAGLGMPRAKGRNAGLFWALTFIFGMLAFRLMSRPGLARWGGMADLIATMCYVATTVYVYEILQVVDRGVALIGAFFSLIGCTVSAVGLVFRFAAFAQPGTPPLFRTSSISFVFFGLHCLLVGYLIARSTFLPRVIGLLMILAGLGWMARSVAALLLPSVPPLLANFVMFSGALGEGTLSLWLLIAGVNVPRWVQQATEH